MTRISQKKERCPKNGYFDLKIKNFHKSKNDGLQKLSTRAPWFYDFLHFKGCSYLNHKISFILSVQVAIFLVFHNLFVMLFHILMSISDHELMLDNFLITSSVLQMSLQMSMRMSANISKFQCKWHQKSLQKSPNKCLQ